MSQTPNNTDSNVEHRTLNVEQSLNNPSDPAPPGLLDYLEIISRRKRMIIGITAAATIITALYTLMLPNIYTAKAKVLPPNNRPAGFLPP